jgi:threonine aldolase
MRFLSDNAAPACPEVLAGLAAANVQDTPYDGDRWSAALDARFSALFDIDVAVLWVPTGTAANCLALAALCPPDGAVICHREAHIQADEAGAPEFFTHGAKLLLAEGTGAKLDPDAIRAVLDTVKPGIHWVQPHAISITNATEYGLAYAPAEVAAIGALAREHGLRLHMDGARLANALAHLDCAPADLTWRAGVDALSFGFIKNGGLGADALIFFDPALADGACRRRKRAGHLQSKGRYLAAQLLAMLDGDVWLRNARAANAGAALLGAAAPGRLVHPVESNGVFLRVTPEEAAALRARGFDFYDWAPGEIRLMVSWDQGPDAVRPLADALAAL